MADSTEKDRTFREWFPPASSVRQCNTGARRSTTLGLDANTLSREISTILKPSPRPVRVLGHSDSTHPRSELRFPGLKGSNLLRRIFIREKQDFEHVATAWERTYEPAFGARPVVPDIYTGSRASSVRVEMPVMDERGTIRGYLLNKYEDDGTTVLLVDIDGNELAAEFKARGNIQSDEIGNLLVFLIASGGLALIRRGVTLLLESGGEATAEILSQSANKAATARSMVRALQAEGQEVVVNVGGEGSAAEAAQWPRAINLNPIKPG